MRTVIRQRAFETNSSSCHSIVIADASHPDVDYNDYRTSGGTFGRFDKGVFSDTAGKLDYFWQVLLDNCDSSETTGPFSLSDWEGIIMEHLPYARLEVDYDPNGFPNGYIDHGGSYAPMLEQMYADRDLVSRLLLGDKSFVAMSSDEDYERPPYPDCDYIEFENE